MLLLINHIEYDNRKDKMRYEVVSVQWRASWNVIHIKHFFRKKDRKHRPHESASQFKSVSLGLVPDPQQEKRFIYTS